MAKKGKKKYESCCYDCKYMCTCKDAFNVDVCDEFKFNSVSKSI